MVLAAGVRRLEARDAVARVDAGHKPHAVQELQRAIDAGDADRRAGVTQAGVDLLGAGAAGLGCQLREDGATRAAGAGAGASQGQRGVGEPRIGRVLVRMVCLGHGQSVEDTDRRTY